MKLSHEEITLINLLRKNKEEFPGLELLFTVRYIPVTTESHLQQVLLCKPLPNANINYNIYKTLLDIKKGSELPTLFLYHYEPPGLLQVYRGTSID
jgi:hypothetical protein